MRLVFMLAIAIIVAFIGYALGSDVTGNLFGAIVFAIVGFALGMWGSALMLAVGNRRDRAPGR